MSTRTLPPTQLRSVVTLTLSPSPPTTSVTSTFSAFARPPPPTNSTSSPINFLPAEVLALIIELAAGTRYERKRVLPGLALVARAWREPAQRELFRRPWIMSSGGADKWLKSPARKRYKVSSAALAGSLEGSANLAERLAGRIERTLQVAAELRGIETLYLCLYTTVDGKLFSLPALSGEPDDSASFIAA